MCHLGTLPTHRSCSFSVLLTGNTVITPLGTPSGTLQMSHSGTPGVLSLGKFKVSPRCSQLGHPGHMTWNTAGVLTIFCAGDISIKLARKIQDVLGVCWVGLGQVHCPFPCSVFVVYGVGTLGFAPSDSPLGLSARRTGPPTA